MKKTLFAAAAVAALAGAANADITYTFTGGSVGPGGGQSITSDALTGTLTGIFFSFTFVGTSTNDSWASDIAAVVGASQWGGFNMMLHGSTIDEGDTGAANSSAAVVFNSAFLPIGSNVVFTGETTLVGWGNAYDFSTGAIVSEISITLVGVTPTPGAAAVLGLAGLAGFRRRRA